MLFYKLKLLSYILGNFKNTMVRLFLLIVYLYVLSITLMFLSYGFQYALEASSPVNAFYELYKYTKICYMNKNDLGYGILIRTLLALLIPIFCYRMLLRTNWKRLFRKAAVKCVRIFGGRRVTQSSNSGCNMGYYYDHDYKLVNSIKEILMHDIEQAIDKRLHEIFFTKQRDKD
jgi:hypothetical protein